ncbi:MAG: endonuclease/exonuclease/phosphatase family protein [Prolixibacteraceae bacterium]|nr:endonuclease/exonuclease/phosphatase family protein [Prolixibacteraceae bacterium]
MFLLSLIIILSGYNNLKNYIQIKGSHYSKKGIVVCSYNVRNFAGKTYGENTKEDNADSICSYIKNKDPDIICLQETNMIMINKIFMPKIVDSKEYSSEIYSTKLEENGDPVIFSKYPVINEGKIHFKETRNMILYADIIINEDTVRIFNCHLQSYRLSNSNISDFNDFPFEDNKNDIKKILFFNDKLKKAFVRRAEHADSLKTYIKKCPYPVIVCGDFNDTPVSYAYNTISNELKDTFVESGSGIGNTYLGELPSFRIDYIFHSKEFSGYNFSRDMADYSDHYPISCTLIRKKVIEKFLP